MKLDPSRKTPAFLKQDGVDYIPMPTWKIFMIQFLNIAGLGPIFGAIMGAKFGTASFLWIVLGSIFAGAVHDFIAGVLSLRHDGESLPEIIGRFLGNNFKQFMRAFTVVLMVLVGVVFVAGPAGLLASLTPEHLDVGLDFDNVKKYNAIMGSGGLVVMDENTCMVEVARFFMSFTQRESCGKCVPCREGTKRMLEILERIVNGEGKIEDLDTLEEIATMVQNMALCGLGKSAPLPVLSTLKTFRKEYEEHILEHKCAAKNCSAMRKFVINPEFCKGCGKCAKNCPVGAITGVRKEAYHIDTNLCIKCGACKDNCAFDAVYIEA